ncbi:MAG: zinc dependent phospholipase C family protein [Clostridia bacterium]|jgi:hypothetical protein|nr:zinc dependent phospholipase C family protein [Clostridia bacterium]
MPNLITHIYLAREVEKLLDDELKAIIEKHKDAFLFGSIGPDYLFALREMGLEIGRYPNIMQYVKQYEVFTRVSKFLNEKKDPTLISYTLGLMCHYVADLHCHPYVNFFCEEGVVKDLRPIQAKSVHTLIESAGDEYICTMRMGYKNSNKYKPNKDLRTKKKTRMKVGEMYEQVINNLFGIPLPAKKAALSVQLTKIFLGVANDPTGKLRPIIDKIEDKYASKKKFTALMRPPEGYGKVDYLNFNHREWRVARNRDQVTNLDFMELIDTAIKTAANIYVPMLYSAIKDGTEMDKSFFRVNYEGVDIAYIEEQLRDENSPNLSVYVRELDADEIINEGTEELPSDLPVFVRELDESETISQEKEETPQIKPENLVQEPVADNSDIPSEEETNSTNGESIEPGVDSEDKNRESKSGDKQEDLDGEKVDAE